MSTVGSLRFPQWILRDGNDHAPASRELEAKKTVLCVDSYKPVLTTLERILTEAGYKVFTADSVSEALAICSEQHIDLAILDCGLPSGAHACVAQQIRNLQRGVQLVVWSPLQGAGKRARPCAHVHFMKPLRAPEMLQRLEALLQP